MRPRGLSFLPLCFFAAASAAPAKTPASDKELLSMMDEMSQERAAMEPLIERLKSLQPRYAEEAADPGFAEDRKALRVEIDSRRERLSKTRLRFDAARTWSHAHKVAFLISDAMGGGKRRYERTLEDALQVDAFGKDMNGFLSSAGVELIKDEQSYRLARDSIFRRRLTYGAAAVAAVLLLGMGLLLMRRQAPPETVTGVPVTPLPIRRGTLPPDPVPSTLLADRPPPEVVGGRYRIVKSLGSGNVGAVYEAMDQTLKRPVLLKRVREEFHRSGKDLERFLAQARSVAALRHPNLAEILAVLHEGERVYLAVEYVPGRSLRRFLDSGSRVEGRSIKLAVSQVAAALEYAHGELVVHGDLTPSNILIDPKGAVKVTDFGIALIARTIAAKHSLPTTGASMPYLAPEVELGQPCKESDLYALGAILYEMAVGRAPFDGPNFLAQKREMRFTPVSRLVPRAPAGLDPIIARALQAEVKDRFRSAKELGQAVAALPDV